MTTATAGVWTLERGGSLQHVVTITRLPGEAPGMIQVDWGCSRFTFTPDAVKALLRNVGYVTKLDAGQPVWLKGRASDGDEFALLVDGKDVVVGREPGAGLDRAPWAKLKSALTASTRAAPAEKKTALKRGSRT